MTQDTTVLSKSSSDRVLVLWSGGVESTSLLLGQLRNTTNEVYAHHVQLVTREGRAGMEKAAVDALLPELQAVRPFYYSSSRLELVDGNGLGWDFHFTYLIALTAMRHHRCRYLLRGFCVEDDWHRMIGMAPVHTKYAPDEPHRVHSQRKVMIPFLETQERLEDVSPFIEEYTFPKAWHWQRLGQLAELTWSCRRPVQGKPCGKCHACADRGAARMGTSSIREVADVIREKGLPCLPN